jgi:hypothetical protein
VSRTENDNTEHDEAIAEYLGERAAILEYDAGYHGNRPKPKRSESFNTS